MKHEIKPIIPSGFGVNLDPQVLFSGAGSVYPESSPSEEIDDRER